MVWALEMRIFETHFMHIECISSKLLQNKENAFLMRIEYAFDMHIFDHEKTLGQNPPFPHLR